MNRSRLLVVLEWLLMLSIVIFMSLFTLWCMVYDPLHIAGGPLK